MKIRIFNQLNNITGCFTLSMLMNTPENRLGKYKKAAVRGTLAALALVGSLACAPTGSRLSECSRRGELTGQKPAAEKVTDRMSFRGYSNPAGARLLLAYEPNALRDVLQEEIQGPNLRSIARSETGPTSLIRVQYSLNPDAAQPRQISIS